MRLPLRPEPQPDSQSTNLRYRLEQIDAQKGAFRNVSEQSLRAEIDAHVSSAEEPQTQDESSEGEQETREQRHEKVWKAREEMMRQLDRAKNDTLHALDFISLLLSKSAAGAQSSMSPYLQQNVPTGTLDGRVLRNTEPSLAAKRRLDAVSRGWKTRTFADVADKLSQAGSRLASVSTHESSFWEQVSQIQAQGWSISRLPKDSRAIGVHFGFSESAPRFRNRGFAVLRQDHDGKLELDQHIDNLHDRAVQISVLRNGHLTGRSSVRRQPHGPGNPLLGQIELQRNALFEEELFYEAGREGRLIANEGVTVSSGTINLKITEDLHIQLSSLPVDKELNEDASKDTDDDLAEALSLALKLLLVEAHHENFRRRTQPPPAMSLKPRPIHGYALLRPIITQLRHHQSVKQVMADLAQLSLVAKAAGLSFAVTTTKSIFDDTSHASESVPFTMNTILSVQKSSLRIQLTADISLNLTIHSSTGPPLYGTEFTLSPLPHPLDTIHFVPGTTESETISAISTALTAAVVLQLTNLPVTTPAAPPPPNTPTPDTQPNINLQWKIHPDPQAGAFSLIDTTPDSTTSNDSHQTLARFSIHISPTQIGFRIKTSSSLSSSRPKKQPKTYTYTYRWTADGNVARDPPDGKEEGSITMERVIRDVLRDVGVGVQVGI